MGRWKGGLYPPWMATAEAVERELWAEDPGNGSQWPPGLSITDFPIQRSGESMPEADHQDCTRPAHSLSPPITPPYPDTPNSDSRNKTATMHSG